MLKIVRILLLLGLLITAITAQVQAASPIIVVLDAKGVINPVLADYINRGIEEAEDNNATAVIIRMDTPGGLVSSMLEIVEDIIGARVPVVVYVAPAGAWAASAGVFITMSAHVAVMAPATNIGAAHPVTLGGEGEEGLSETEEEKILSILSSKAKTTAELHGRNAEWAEGAVRESISATEQEALELNVIDMIAPDLEALIVQLDGVEVTMLGGALITLNTQDVTIRRVEMSWMEEFLYAISDPNIAYLLLSLATLGIFVEISNPGLIFPGIVGAICGILAFYSLGNLPVNIAGILFIGLAFALFIGEVFTTTFGLFTAGGVISLVLGSLILFKGGPLFQVNPWLIASIAISISAFLTFVINRIIRAHHRQAFTGWEELIGKTALVKAALDPDGTVLFKGERWTAASETGRIEPGQDVTINRVESLKLYVTKKQ